MKITNKIKFAAVTLLLLAGSVNQALAQDWSSGEVYSKANTTYSTGNTFNDLKSFGNGGWNTTAGRNGIQTNDYYIKNTKDAPYNGYCRSISYHSWKRAIPSYSKLVRTSSFTLYIESNRSIYNGCGLYFFDIPDGGRNTVLDASYSQNGNIGDSYLIKKSTYEATSSAKSMVWDNNSGSTDQNIEKLILFMFSSHNANINKKSGTDIASWKENLSSETWYYYKHFKFMKNDGTGTQYSAQTIENSGTLTFPAAPTSLGCKFLGWNTEPDGTGTTTYTNGQAITATSTDKGEIVLYAQWEVDPDYPNKWTNIGFRSGSWGWSSSTDYTISYDDIETKRSSASWGDQAVRGKYWNTIGEQDYALNIDGPSGANQICIEIGLYRNTRKIPSYTKLVRSATFQEALQSNRHHHGAGLYLFDDEATAKSTYLDANYLQGKNHGTPIVKKGSTNTQSVDLSNAVASDLTYDNSTGAEASDISKYIAFEHSSANGGPSVAGYEWASWIETASTDYWYYYKHFTFNPNGCTGDTMAVQTIWGVDGALNNWTLNSNTYIRPGYKFTGWNTKADGTGTYYANKASVSASSNDKGEVTLYAQWEIDESNSYIFLGGRSGSWYRSNDNCISYNGIGDNNTTSWGTNFGTQSISHMSENASTVKTNNTNIAIGIYQTARIIPSYSKLVRSVNFQIAMTTTRYDHGAGLYLFDDLNTAQSTALDATYNQVRSDGNDYKLVKYFNVGKYETRFADGSKTLSYDNCSASTPAVISKYVAMEHSSGSGSTQDTGKEDASWKETSSTETWYYYKYLTFDANEGTGTAMAEQTIENSGNLTANTYTRTGYTFAGWNTQADGSGTAYTDGQEITATLEDKGPVTLYAQWAVEVPVSESGSATIFADKNLVVPDDVKVYGFVYMDGALMQGTEITAGAILPANNGYLVKATAAGTYTFVPTDATATAPTSDLTGTTVEINTPSGNVYVWGKPEDYNYGWYKYEGTTIPAGKAYYIKKQ